MHKFHDFGTSYLKNTKYKLVGVFGVKEEDIVGNYSREIFTMKILNKITE